MLARLEKDRAVYLQHMESFKSSYGVVLKQGHALMANLDEEHIDELFAKSARDIEGSWTTAGLWRSMNSLFDSFTRQADKILSFASETRNFVDKVYQEFQEKYGFVNLTPPPLNLEKHILSMKGLKTEHRALLPRSGQRHDREALPGEEVLQRPGHRGAHRVPGGAQGPRQLAEERA